MDPASDRPSDDPAGLPRWVVVLMLAAGVVVVLLGLVMILSGGDHGPGRHLG